MNVFDALRNLVANRLSLLLIGALVLVLPLLITSSFHLRIAIVVWVYALAAIGLNLLMGFAGQVSLGHAGFFGIGAYSVALGPSHLGLSSALSLPAGVVFCGLVALILGKPILRLKGHYLAVATLGFGMLVFMVLTNEVALTGGPDGVQVQRVVIMGWTVKGTDNWYWITGGALIIGVWLALNLMNSPTGLALRAIRDSEIAASVLGVDVARYKLIVFVISACFAATAGGALALYNGHVTPGVADFLISVQMVTMVVLGGMGSVAGSLVGAALIVMLPQFLTALHEYEHAFLGLVMILTMIFMRSGIVPSISSAIGWARHDRNS
jgi:branched-chain amino acid transport system permease protein